MISAKELNEQFQQNVDRELQKLEECFIQTAMKGERMVRWGISLWNNKTKEVIVSKLMDLGYIIEFTDKEVITIKW